MNITMDVVLNRLREELRKVNEQLEAADLLQEKRDVLDNAITDLESVY